MSKARCFAKKAPEDGGPPLFQHGTVVFQAHHVGWIVTGFFTVIATVTSFWLVNRHLQWYTNKREQRHIVRLLFMVPIYAMISFASYLFWNHHTPLLLLRDGYESTVLTAFFYLLLNYLSPTQDEQRAIFLKVGLSRQADREALKKGEAKGKWMFPLGIVKWKPEDGLYFLQLMKWGVLQYCVVRPLTTLAAIILDYVGLYCEDSWSLRWAHPYITIVVSISVSIAMYCLVQVYMPISTHLAHHKPLLKLFAIKAVVFLTFWQATFLGLLSAFRVVKDTPYMTADDINIGYGAILETFEMTLFAFLHIKAFSYKPYRPSSSGSTPPTRTPRLRALGHAMDFRETFREIWTGTLYLLDRVRGHEPRPDIGARRVAHLEEAFGKGRPSYPLDHNRKQGAQQKAKPLRRQRLEVEVEQVVDIDVGGERQWLGTGDDYAYGLGYARRDKSDGLGDQIAKELQSRGLGSEAHRPTPVDKPSISWWRNVYNRISQSGTDHEGSKLTSTPSKSKFRSQRLSRDRFLLSSYEYDEPPPLSAIRLYHNQRRRESNILHQIQQQEQLEELYEDPSADKSILSPMSITMVHPTFHQDLGGPHITPLPAQTPLSPLSPRLDDIFAQSTTNFDNLDEPGTSRSPDWASVSLNGLVILQPPVAKPTIVAQSQCHESEVGDVQTDRDKCPPAEAAAVISNQVMDVPQEIPPPVPPKTINWDQIPQEPPRRPSHRRESALHQFTPLSPSSNVTPASGPGLRPARSSLESSPEPLDDLYFEGPSTFAKRSMEPSIPGQLSGQDISMPTNSPESSEPRRNAVRIHNVPSRRHRDHSLPVPTSYAVPTVPVIPKNVYPRRPSTRAHRRLSAPLGRIPQHSVPVLLNSQHHTDHRSPYTVIDAHDSHLSTPPMLAPHVGHSRYPEYREPKSRSSRRYSHVPRVPIMPQPLAETLSRQQGGKPTIRERQPLGSPSYSKRSRATIIPWNPQTEL